MLLVIIQPPRIIQPVNMQSTKSPVDTEAKKKALIGATIFLALASLIGKLIRRR